MDSQTISVDSQSRIPDNYGMEKVLYRGRKIRKAVRNVRFVQITPTVWSAVDKAICSHIFEGEIVVHSHVHVVRRRVVYNFARSAKPVTGTMWKAVL